MPTTAIEDILLLCLSLENTAQKFYLSMAEKSTFREHKDFWHKIALDEKSHIEYWKKILERERGNPFASPFENPDEIKAEFEDMLAKMEGSVAESQEKVPDIYGAMLVALRLETTLLHPAFFILFRSLKNTIDTTSFEEEYCDHIDNFSGFARRHLQGKPEMELIGEVLFKMLQYGREISSQFDQIKTLKGLIPICANCKKVRDDEGYWSEIEAYLRKFSDAQFSHSVCPACAEKLYPGLLDEDN